MTHSVLILACSDHRTATKETTNTRLVQNHCTTSKFPTEFKTQMLKKFSYILPLRKCMHDNCRIAQFICTLLTYLDNGRFSSPSHLKIRWFCKHKQSSVYVVPLSHLNVYLCAYVHTLGYSTHRVTVHDGTQNGRQPIFNKVLLCKLESVTGAESYSINNCRQMKALSVNNHIHYYD